MKKILFIGFVAFAFASNAYALENNELVDGFSCTESQICCSYTDLGYCQTCAASYEDCPVYTCICEHDSDTSTAFTNWVSTDTANLYKRCVQSTSTLSNQLCGMEYSCAAGYYLTTSGFGVSVTGTCTKCPTSSDGATITSAANNTGGITSCYITSGSSFADTYGSGVYTSDCYYK